MDFRSTLLLPNFWTLPQRQPCSLAQGIFPLLVFMAKVAKKNCQTSIEKVYLAFDCKYVSWVCLCANCGTPLRQTRVCVRPEAMSGTPLLEQEFTLREATVSKGLEVRIYSYTDRQPIERNNEYTHKSAVKCNQNNYAKAQAIISAPA